MKPIFLFLAVGFLFISCSVNNDGPTETLETLPVSNVTIPTQYAKDSITEIPVSYVRPTVCHTFYDFYYLREGLTRTVAILALKENGGSGCPASQMTYTVPLKFKPTALGTYHFKFWTGANAQGVDQYTEYDAVVNH